MSQLSRATRELLKRCPVSAITTVMTRLGLRSAFMSEVRPISPDQPTMVGQAFTLRYIPAREDIDTMAAVSRDDALQRRALEHCPEGYVLVIDARGDTRTACAGDMFLTRLKQRGCAGVVTDGGLRDVGPIRALGFPAFLKGSAAPPTFLAHHPVDMDVPIGCGGVAVYPGDVVVGDCDGVVVIPLDRAEEVAEGAIAIVEYDEFVEAQLAQGRSLIGLYPATAESRREYETWRATRRTS
ncbi:MAG TPA: hypothetical protein VJQ47_04150 [Steroidobacteraceae bacterium]|nr:hypothetical protein [Steroidobacteraceae bacterium]